MAHATQCHDNNCTLPEQAQSVEEAHARRERLAKMRSLLFHQEAKLKHLAKIKSKDYHRRAKRAAQAKASALLRYFNHPLATLWWFCMPACLTVKHVPFFGVLAWAQTVAAQGSMRGWACTHI